MPAQLLCLCEGARWPRQRDNKRGPTSVEPTEARRRSSLSYALVDSTYWMTRVSSSLACTSQYTRDPRTSNIPRRLPGVQPGGAEGIRTPDLRLAKAARGSVGVRSRRLREFKISSADGVFSARGRASPTDIGPRIGPGTRAWLNTNKARLSRFVTGTGVREVSAPLPGSYSLLRRPRPAACVRRVGGEKPASPVSTVAAKALRVGGRVGVRQVTERGGQSVAIVLLPYMGYGIARLDQSDIRRQQGQHVHSGNFHGHRYGVRPLDVVHERGTGVGRVLRCPIPDPQFSTAYLIGTIVAAGLLPHWTPVDAFPFGPREAPDALVVTVPGWARESLCPWECRQHSLSSGSRPDPCLCGACCGIGRKGSG